MIVFSYWYALLPCLFCLPAQAHRLDEYLQAATIGLASDGVSIQVRLSAGQAVAQRVWAQMDGDRDGQLSPAEQRAYALRMLAGLTLTIDGKPQPLSLQNWSFPMRADIDKGMGEVSLHLHAPLHVAAGRHHLHFESRRQREISIYMVNALMPSDHAVQITSQQRSSDQAIYDLHFSLN